MRCLHPVELIRPKSNTPYFVSCGCCPACRINRTQEWTIRIIHENMIHKKSCFVTLTYDEKYLPRHGSLRVKDIQGFFKRLRKSGYKVRYFACGEYGDKYLRPHYHAIIFGLGKEDENIIRDHWSIDKINKEGEYEIDSITGKYIREQIGRIDVGTVTPTSAAYTARYIQKKLMGKMKEFYKINKIIPEFLLCSRNPSIGSSYAVMYIESWIQAGYIMMNGKKVPIPKRYYDLLTDEQIEELKKYLNVQRYLREKEVIEFAGIDYFEYCEKEVESLEQREKNLLGQIKMSNKKL